MLGHGHGIAPFAGILTSAAGQRTLQGIMTSEHISYESPFPTVLAVDGRERVIDFLNRHGGAAPDAEHEAEANRGLSGWSEVHAVDGYRLRCEWSVLGSERRLNFVEIAPGCAVIDTPC